MYMQNPDTKKIRTKQEMGDASMEIINEIRQNTEKEYKPRPIEPDIHIWAKRETITAELGDKTEPRSSNVPMPCFQGFQDDRSHGQRGRSFTQERSRSPVRENVGLWDIDENDADDKTGAWRYAGETTGAWRNAGHKLDNDRATMQKIENTE